MAWAFIMLGVLAASVIGVFIYQMNESTRKSGVDTSGFNLSLDIDTATVRGPAAASQEQSSLQMVGSAPSGMKFGTPAAAAPPNLAGSKKNSDVMKKMQGAASGLGADQK